MAAAVISDVIEGSLAAKAHIKPGDQLISVNGVTVNDILDYQYACTEEELRLLIRDNRGRERMIKITKDLDADLGLVFAEAVFDGIMRCQNRCQFCFVDQMPKKLRRSLYLKDDDYRYSFLFGSFVTLGNLREQDWAKIEKYHLSPLYISVHATDPNVRQKLVRPRNQPDIMADMRRLAEMGIEMHTQIVLCPGLNDGGVLEQTINDLASLIPWVRSVGIVPVGLTAFRGRLPQLVPVNADLARVLIEKGEEWQLFFRQVTADHIGFVYLADEFYIKAGLPLPPAEYYDGYPQIENGIGLGRWYLSGWDKLEVNLPTSVDRESKYIMVCGHSAVPVLTPIVNRLNSIKNLQVDLLPIENRFFGGLVTVTGLLTGRDIIVSVKAYNRRGVVLLPRVVLKEGEDRLLDEVTVQDIEEATGFTIKVVGMEPLDLVKELGLLPSRRPRSRVALRRTMSY